MSAHATGGLQTRINTYTASYQSGTSITALADGGWVATWESALQDGDSYGIYQQRYDAAGRTIGLETHVSSTIAGSQYASAVTALADGGWVVTWTSLFQDGDAGGVYQQRYDGEGFKVDLETRVNTTTEGDQYGFSNTALADGGWVVTWTSNGQDGSDSGIYQQRYNSEGLTVGSELRVNTTTLHSQIAATVTALSDGGWVATWTSYDQDGDATGVYQQRYAAYGAKVGSETLVNTETAGNQVYSVAASLADGGWVVTWVSNVQDGDNGGIYQQRYDADGDRIGSETLVNTTTYDGQVDPSITGLADGGWVTTWSSFSQDGDGAGIYQQRYGVDGHRIGSETRVAITTAGDQSESSVVALADGGWVVSWMSSAGAATDVYQRHFAADVEGGALGDTLIGTGWDETLIGYGGNDRLDGAGGNDVMIGGFGNDTYVVDSVSDIIQELAAQGTDTAESSISFSLGLLGSFGGVENLVLTGGGNLDGTGNALANMVTGSAGNNVIDGGKGADTMTGGLGNDTYIVDNAGDKVIEASGGGSDTVNASVSFTLASSNWVEILQTTLVSGSAAIDLTGNNNAQGIIGNNGANKLGGLGGDDLLFGMGGNDTLTGGAGKDSFQFNTQLNSASNVDAITDFNVVDDTIKLDDAIFTKLGVGALSSDAFWKSTAGVAHDTSDRIIYDTDSGALFYDADGNMAGGVGAIKFAVVGINLGLTNLDFAVS